MKRVDHLYQSHDIYRARLPNLICAPTVSSSFTSFEKPLTLRHSQLQSPFNGRFVADGVREEGGLQHQGGPWTCQIWFDLSGVNICTLLQKYWNEKMNF